MDTTTDRIIKSKVEIKTKKACKTKWIYMSSKIAIDEYDMQTANCKQCGRQYFPCFIHNKYGDYMCFLCENSGDIRQLCFNCCNKI